MDGDETNAKESESLLISLLWAFVKNFNTLDNYFLPYYCKERKRIMSF